MLQSSLSITSVSINSEYELLISLSHPVNFTGNFLSLSDFSFDQISFDFSPLTPSDFSLSLTSPSLPQSHFSVSLSPDASVLTSAVVTSSHSRPFLSQ